MKKIFNNRRTLYFILCIVIVSVFILTIAYAALNSILNITGSAEVVASSWDIRLENPIVTSGSVNNNVPVITNNTTASFSATLTNPGDFYEFTIDIVNNGSIDAMIDSIEKLPQLSTTQTKYLNYLVEYQNGDSINKKQLVEANSFVRLKVKVEFRKDISSTDLPSQLETLNLLFKVNYVQAEETGTSIVPNSGKIIKIVSGDYDTVGSEICIEEECFYVISSTGDTVTMLSKYNLLVGNKYDDANGAVPLENPTGIQDERAKGWFSGFSVDNPLIGTTPFSSTNYWSSTVSTYPAYVYNENSYMYEYVENYKTYLSSLGVTPSKSRLISIEELEGLGCSSSSYSCSEAPSWVYSTVYCSGSADSSTHVWRVIGHANFYSNNYNSNDLGVRPVITISKSYF